MEFVLCGRIKIPFGSENGDQIIQICHEAIGKTDHFLKKIRKIAEKDWNDRTQEELLYESLLFTLITDELRTMPATKIFDVIDRTGTIDYHKDLCKSFDVSKLDEEEIVVSSEDNAQPWILGGVATSIMRSYDLDGVAKGALSARAVIDGPAQTHPHFGMSVAASKFGYRTLQLFEMEGGPVIEDLEYGMASFLVSVDGAGNPGVGSEPPVIVRVSGVCDEDIEDCEKGILDNFRKFSPILKEGDINRQNLPDPFQDLSLEDINNLAKRACENHTDKVVVTKLSPQSFHDLKNIFWVVEHQW